MTTFQITLIAGGFTVLGTIIGILLGYFLNRNTAKEAIDLAFTKTIELLIKQKFLDVGAEFRSEFANQMRLLRERYHEFGQKPDFKTTRDIIEAGLVQHELAWLRFRELLPDDKQIRLDKLWMKYSYENKKLPGDPFWGYKVPQRWDKKFGSIEAENKIRNIALDRITKLFDFTQLHG